jgi:predicted nucleic acid-binding protein
MPSSIVISDTSNLIVLSKIDSIELLHKLYSRVITTPEIIREFGEPLPKWIEVLNAKDLDFQKTLELQIDLGEASAIALAHEIPEAILVLDDLKARKIARDLNMKFTGTLGVLGKAKSKGIIPSLKPLLDKLLRTNFGISNAVIYELLKKHGESG